MQFGVHKHNKLFIIAARNLWRKQLVPFAFTEIKFVADLTVQYSTAVGVAAVTEAKILSATYDHATVEA